MRTIEDFVTDAICRDRTREEIRCIAICTRWNDAVNLVLKTYDRLCAPLENKKVA